jgi:hypothetical protein
MLRPIVLAGLLVATSAFQTAPAAPTYDAKYSVQTPDGAQDYTGTTTFAVDAKGVVTGKMTLNNPTVVTANLNGTIKDGVWTFEYEYAIPDRNCTGTVKGTGKVPADRKLISGSAAISGACAEQPLTATFSFTRQEAK